MNGSNQTIQVVSRPDGAECIFSRGTTQLAKVVTPGPVVVPRDRRPIDVVCTIEGYSDARTVMHSTAADGSPLVHLASAAAPAPIYMRFAVSTVVNKIFGARPTYETVLTVDLESVSSAGPAGAAPSSLPPWSAAIAETFVPKRPTAWKARTILRADKSSTDRCGTGGVVYSFVLVDNRITVEREGQRVFEVPVPWDGGIRQTYKAGNDLTLEMAGNVRSRDLEVTDAIRYCQWRLISE